jgi:hypothetical protein
MYDPIQAYTTLGAYSLTNPAAFNPLAATLGISSQLGAQGYQNVPVYGGINPQQLQQVHQLQQLQQLHQLQQQMQNPWNQVGFQNPAVLAALQNPQLLASLQNPLMNPVLHQLAAYGQQPGLQHHGIGFAGSPFGQIPGHMGSPYGQVGLPLAPQTWIGQGTQFGQGGQVGGINPYAQNPLVLAQLATRGLQQGITPWGF